MVGPAGAGKTAVMHAIRRRDSTVRTGLRIESFRSLPMIARHALALAPTGLQLLWENPRAWAPCMQHLLRLRTLRTLVARKPERAYRAIILDEGPVFSFCRLTLFRKATRRSTPVPAGWRRTLRQWSGVVDLVIWLDAPDSILIHRIRSRPKDHEVKARPEREMHEFLERFRITYRAILADLASAGRLRVLELNTAELPADEIAQTVLSALQPVLGPQGSGGDR